MTDEGLVSKIYKQHMRLNIIKKITNKKCWQGWREKRAHGHCWWKCKLVQPLWKTVWNFLKNLKTELLYDPTVPTPEY